MGYFSLKSVGSVFPVQGSQCRSGLSANVCCSGHGDKEERHGALIDLANVPVAEGVERVVEDGEGTERGMGRKEKRREHERKRMLANS